MSLRKFLNGRISPLTMSAAGAGDPAGAGAGGSGGDPAAAAAGAGADKGAWSFPTEKAFAEYLPEEFRADPSLRDVKDFKSLVSSFVNAQRLVGADKATILQLPKDGDEKAQGEFYNRLGRPETADKYEIGKRADGKDYSEADKAFHKELLPVLHKAGLSQKQLDAIRPAWDAMADAAAGGATKAAESYAAEQQTKLKTDLGASYDQTMSDAQLAITHYGDAELVKELNIIKDGKATGDNAKLLLVLAKIGKPLREDGVIGRGGANAGGALSPAEAQQQINAKKADEKFMGDYRNKDAPGHAAAVEDMRKLFEFAYPPLD